jgi:ABC-type nitrate/sulfonate/bicarbonate transport system substrate-binding protein
MFSKPLALRRAAIAALIAGGFAAAASAQDTVRYGAQLGAQYSLNVLLKENQAKYNLKYDFKEFRSGTENILALEQREVDISTATTQHLLRAIEENMPIVWVIGWGGGYNTLVARADLPVNAGDYAALKALALKRAAEGKKLKIAAPTGSMQHLVLLAALKEAGIDANKDVDIVNIPFPVHPRAIESGEVDMASALALFGAMSITSGKGKLFHHLFGEKWGKQEIGFFLHKKLVEEKPELAQRIVASLAEAIAKLTDSTVRLELEAKGSKLPQPILAMTEKEFLRVDLRTNMSDVKLMAERMHAQGWTKRDIAGDVQKNVDFRFLEKATGKTKAELSAW